MTLHQHGIGRLTHENIDYIILILIHSFFIQTILQVLEQVNGFISVMFQSHRHLTNNILERKKFIQIS